MSTPQEPEQPEEPQQPEPGAYEAQPSSEPQPNPEAPAASSPPPQPAQPSPPPQAPQYAPQPGYQQQPLAQGAQPGYQQNPYPQQPGYQQPAPTGSKPRTWMNITSFVTSILGLGLIGVIFGHLGVSASNKQQADLKGLGIAGLILGYVQIVLGIIFAIIFVTAVANCADDPECRDFWDSIEWTTE